MHLERAFQAEPVCAKALWQGGLEGRPVGLEAREQGMSSAASEAGRGHTAKGLVGPWRGRHGDAGSDMCSEKSALAAVERGRGDAEDQIGLYCHGSRER